ncbi:ABC transporter permease [Paraglaciecola sp.]|uniref:ABC transporter permease n=1 Tax=Paraglaciecola sp. TaxID=1920173 RepID=UPI00273DA856|nr:ABC transporter permease [Paraglaciecola sp.]MDP5029228.1 ABC transporter permease [Paraglaciecola sp.]
MFALFAREIRTGFNDKFGISWAVINPITFIFMLSFMRGRLDGGLTHGLPTFVFMAYGFLLIQSFLQTLGASATSIAKNKALFAFRQVQPISAVIAASLFELLVKIFVLLGILLSMYFLKMDVQIENPLLLIASFGLLWIFAMALGLIFGLAEMFVAEIRKVREIVTRPLFFVSGVFFSLQDFPMEHWYLLNWNPILHAIELSRFAAYSDYGDAGVSLLYLAISTLVSVFLALVIYQASWKQAISR